MTGPACTAPEDGAAFGEQPKRATKEARDSDEVEETQSPAEEAEGEKWFKKRKRLQRQCKVPQESFSAVQRLQSLWK